MVRRGLVFRADAPDRLTKEDHERLGELGIRLVCDFRTEAEGKPDRSKWTAPAPRFFPQPIEPRVDQARVFAALRLAPTAETSRHAVMALYRSLPSEGAAQFGALLRRLAAGDLPAVYHCLSGKDRTGVFTAILLKSLGVADEVVMQDYLLSNAYLLESGTARRLVGLMKEFLKLDGAAEEVLRPFLGVEVGYLLAAFDSIQREHGGFESYRERALGVGDRELAELRARLLE